MEPAFAAVFQEILPGIIICTSPVNEELPGHLIGCIG
jgi:hypothetical protein